MPTTTNFQLVPTDKLIPYINNARTHSKEQITKLRSSLREFGFINPIIIDKNFNVIAGHGRLEASKAEGMEKVPCVFVEHFTEAQKKAYILADNRMALDAVATYGTGGNNQPLVVTFGICAKNSNSMLSDNPHSGFYQAETARTLDTSNQSPCKNQGGIVVLEGNGSRPSHHGDGYKESETMYTLNATEQHAVAFSQDAYDKYSENLQCGSLRASGGVYGGGSEALVCSSAKKPLYKVRRLTPQECALLQGMPTWWCSGLEIENPTEDELNFWRDVFETHRKATIPDKKPKSDKQIIKWLKNPHSDSAEYKMWGNGIAMPCAWFVLAGIVHFAD